MAVLIRCLGSPEIWVDGERISIPLRKVEALLYYLACNGPVARERLASLLWGGRDREIASNNLRNALYQLKRAFPSGTVLSDRRQVQLDDGVVSDLEDIDSLSDLSFSAWERLCQEFLLGFEVPESDEYTEWLRAERFRWKDRILSELRSRASAAHDAQNRWERRAALSALIRLDPHDEDSCLELMELDGEDGHLSQALNLFGQLRQRLIEDLGIVPSSRATAFASRLLSSRSSGIGNGASGDFFFGRGVELESIISVMATNPEECLCISLIGESGIGKTALVRHVLRLHDGDQSMIFRCKAYEAGALSPFSPWHDLFEDVGGLVDLNSVAVDPLKVSLLASVFPELQANRRGTGSYELASLFPDFNPVALGRIIGEVLRGIRGPRTAVLVLEDLQWFDDLSLHLLEGLVQSVKGRCVIFTTSRLVSGRRPRAILKELASRSQMQVKELTLSPFSEDESYRFCVQALGQDVADALERKIIYRDTQGIPLFLSELVKSVRSRGRWGGGDDLLDIISRRTQTLTCNERAFLEALSLFEGGCSLEDIATVIGDIVPLELAAVAEALMDQGMVEERGSLGRSNPTLCFHHGKIREFVYNTMSAFKRKELHKKVALNLESRYTPHNWNPRLSSQLFHHFSCAGLEEKELELHLREMGLHITLNHQLFPLLRDDVLLACSSPFSDRADTEVRLDQAQELLHRLNRKRGADTTLLRMEAAYLELRGGYLIAWGQYREGCHVINRALRITEDQGFDAISLRCLLHLCYHGLQTDNASLLEPHAWEMIRKAKEMHLDPYLGAGLRFLGVARQLQGDFIGADRIFLRSSTLFQELAEVGRPYTLGVLASLNYRGEIRHWRGDLKEALECFESCVRECESKGLFWGLSLFHSNAAAVAFDMGDDELMAHHADQAVSLFERCRGGRSGSMAYSLKAIRESSRGCLDDALTALSRGELLCEPIQKKSWMAVQYMAKAILSRRMTQNSRAKELWGAIIVESPQFYEDRALALFEELHQISRREALKNNLLRV